MGAFVCDINGPGEYKERLLFDHNVTRALKLHVQEVEASVSRSGSVEMKEEEKMPPKRLPQLDG